MRRHRSPPSAYSITILKAAGAAPGSAPGAASRNEVDVATMFGCGSASARARAQEARSALGTLGRLGAARRQPRLLRGRAGGPSAARAPLPASLSRSRPCPAAARRGSAAPAARPPPPPAPPRPRQPRPWPAARGRGRAWSAAAAAPGQAVASAKARPSLQSTTPLPPPGDPSCFIDALTCRGRTFSSQRLSDSVHRKQVHGASP
jgi:hypothetical protein